MHMIIGSDGVVYENSGAVLLGHVSEDLNLWLKFVNLYTKRVYNQHLECDLIAKLKSDPYKIRIISSTKSLQYVNMHIVICVFLISSSQTSSVSKSPSVSGVLSGGEKLRMKQVSCGCDFTVAQESAPAGKIWAWGNNSQAQVC